MAFQPAQRQQQHSFRPSSSAAAPQVERVFSNAQSVPPQQEHSQEWILFSPDQRRDTFTSTASTARTAGRSQLSDFGSLNTAAVSGRELDESAVAAENDEDAETEDLDSLDDGLYAFNEPSSSFQHANPSRVLDQSAQTVLPAHDGLGKFPGDSLPVQEQLWQHERYNPHRHRRRQSLRRSSLHKRIVEQEEEQAPDPRDAENEKFQMIEKWRNEQSRAILDEIERETRRMRRRSHRTSASRSAVVEQSSYTSASALDSMDSSTHPAQPAQSPALPTSTPEPESWWQRLTRKVIRDLMGFDDATLSLIFGESFANTDPGLSASQMIDHAENTTTSTTAEDSQVTRTMSWEDRLLSRIAKELGLLVHHISEHPGAFSAYLRTREPLPYAGLEAAQPAAATSVIRPSSSSSSSRPKSAASPTQFQSADFTPTLAHNHRHHRSTTSSFHNHHHHHHAQRRRQSASTADPSLWGIEEQDEAVAETVEPIFPQFSSTSNNNPKPQDHERERQYWEQDLDVKMVFKFLKGRLSSSTSTPSRVAAATTTMTTSPSPAPPSALHPHEAMSPHPRHPRYQHSDLLLLPPRRLPAPRRPHPPPPPPRQPQRRPRRSRARHRRRRRSAVLPAKRAAEDGDEEGIPASSAMAEQAAGATSAAAAAAAAALPRSFSPVLRRQQSLGSGSCASQSTKRSRTVRSGGSSRSRNYWDIGGSAYGGAGNGTAGAGGSLGSAWGMGWGQV